MEHGWCELVPRLLVVPDHDAREKVLATMWTLRHPCRRQFAAHVEPLERLRDEYGRLAAVEEQPGGTAADDELSYFTDLLRTLNRIISDVTVAKDEL